MTFWEVVLVILAFSWLVGWIVWVHSHSHRRQVDAFLTQLTELHATNKALMDALARKSNTPLIFTRPEPRKSEGWWDVKAPEATQITVDRT